jgi:hypothetical protein
MLIAAAELGRLDDHRIASNAVQVSGGVTVGSYGS